MRQRKEGDEARRGEGLIKRRRDTGGAKHKCVGMQGKKGFEMVRMRLLVLKIGSDQGFQVRWKPPHLFVL